MDFYNVLFNKKQIESGHTPSTRDYYDALFANAVGQKYELKTVKAPLITITDGTDKPTRKATAYINPVQDLHGYDYPWLGGDGKNKLNPSTEILYAYINTTDEKFYNNVADSRSFEFECKPNTTYTISFKSGITPPTIARAGWTSEKLGSKQWVQTYDFRAFADDGYTTITTGNNAVCIAVQLTASWIDANGISPVQIEQSATKTAYSPYSNICPISGFTSADLFVRGKNWFNVNASASLPSNTAFGKTTKRKFVDGTFVKGISGDNYYSSGNAQYSINNNELTVKSKSGGYGVGYVVKRHNANKLYVSYTVLEGTLPYPRIACYASDGTFTRYFDSKTISFREDEDVAVIVFISLSGVTLSNIQLELGDTATTYVPYNPNSTTHTITWQDAVYSGHVDFVSGALSDKTVGAVFDGSNDEQWSLRGNGESTYFTIVIGDYGTVVRSAIISNEYVTVDTINNQNTVIGINCGNSPQYNAAVINVRPANVNGMTVAQFKTFLSNNPLQVVYELSEPTQIQLTPQEVRTLKGVNNIWSDCNGDSEVEYYAKKART